MKPRILDRAIAAFSFLCVAGIASALRAQTAAKPPAATARTEEILELSPFEVKDTSENTWNASSTLLGKPRLRPRPG